MKNNKVTLRPVEPEDLDLLYEWENDTENWLVSGISTPYSKNTLKNYLLSIQDIYNDKQLRLIIVGENNVNFGVLDFFDFDQKNKRLGIGILIDKDFRNQGIGKKALQKAIIYCFETLYLHQIYCNVMASNTHSIKLFESLCFVKCGDKKDWIQTKEGWTNEYTYQLINKQIQKSN